jgi:hypothetical protein
MSTIIGVLGRIDPRPFRVHGLRGPEPGLYAGTVDAQAQSNVDCPYCREPLIAVKSPDMHRIAKVIEEGPASWEIIAEPVPATHVVLMCIPCFQSFTAVECEERPR